MGGICRSKSEYGELAFQRVLPGVIEWGAEREKYDKKSASGQCRRGKEEDFMIKGAQKRMIVVKTGDSAVFEEAYFVLRRESRAERLDMLAEANKIIENCGGNRKRVRSPQRIAVLYAVCSLIAGMILGGAISVLIYAVI